MSPSPDTRELRSAAEALARDGERVIDISDILSKDGNVIQGNPAQIMAVLKNLDSITDQFSPENRMVLGDSLSKSKLFATELLSDYASTLEAHGKTLLSSNPEVAYEFLSLSHALRGKPIALISDVKETLAMYTGGKTKIYEGVKPALFECAKVGPVFFLSGDTRNALLDNFCSGMGFFRDGLSPNTDIDRQVLENIHLAPHTGAIIIYLRSGDEQYRVEKLLGGFGAKEKLILKVTLEQAAVHFNLKERYGFLRSETDKGPGYYHFEEVLDGLFIGDFYPLGVLLQEERSKVSFGGEFHDVISEIIECFDWCNSKLRERSVTSGLIRKGGLATGDARLGTKGDSIKLIKENFLPSNAIITAIDDRIEEAGNGEDMVLGANYAIHVGQPDVAPPNVEHSAIRIISSIDGESGGATPYLLSIARANRLFQILSPDPASLGK